MKGFRNFYLISRILDAHVSWWENLKRFLKYLVVFVLMTYLSIQIVAPFQEWHSDVEPYMDCCDAMVYNYTLDMLREVEADENTKSVFAFSAFLSAAAVWDHTLAEVCDEFLGEKAIYKKDDALLQRENAVLLSYEEAKGKHLTIGDPYYIGYPVPEGENPGPYEYVVAGIIHENPVFLARFSNIIVANSLYTETLLEGYPPEQNHCTYVFLSFYDMEKGRDYINNTSYKGFMLWEKYGDDYKALATEADWYEARQWGWYDFNVGREYIVRWYQTGTSFVLSRSFLLYLFFFGLAAIIIVHNTNTAVQLKQKPLSVLVSLGVRAKHIFGCVFLRTAVLYALTETAALFVMLPLYYGTTTYIYPDGIYACIGIIGSCVLIAALLSARYAVKHVAGKAAAKALAEEEL